MIVSVLDDIPLGEVLRFIKLLYNYEQWETFLSLVEPVLSLLEVTILQAYNCCLSLCWFSFVFAGWIKRVVFGWYESIADSIGN